MTTIETGPDVAETLVLAETFFSVQGEGPSLGRTATFIRTGGCNLACTWCDTPFSWDARRFDLRAELARVPVADVLARVERDGALLAVVTGGEPLLHQEQEGWRTLLDGLARLGRRVEVETNGTIAPDPFTVACTDQFNVSPKLANAGMEEGRRIRPQVLAALAATGKAVFKFVCRTGGDVDEVAVLAADHGLPDGSVWIMPEGRSAEVLAVTTAATVERALAHRFNFTPRLHVNLWGGRRGR